MAKSTPKSTDRQARLAEALRENLRRRKARPTGRGESDVTAEKESEPGARPNPAAKII